MSFSNTQWIAVPSECQVDGTTPPPYLHIRIVTLVINKNGAATRYFFLEIVISLSGFFGRRFSELWSQILIS